MSYMTDSRSRVTSNKMFSEGVSTRSNPHNLHPVFHVIVNDNSIWRTYCGYGTAVEEWPGQFPDPMKLCSKCRGLAKERLDEEMMSDDEIPHFARALRGNEA